MVSDSEDLKQTEQGNKLSETSSKKIFVLQCAHCKTLLGDTCSLVSAQVELSAIVLSKAVNIAVEDSNFEISNNGIDSGSAFHLVKCSGCSNVIGRCYKATPRSLDHIRDMFTLFEDNLLSYPLSCSIENLVTEGTKEDNQNETLYEVKSDIRAMQQMLVILGDRILRMESKFSKTNDC
ncbi:hypothetical protein GpartN1_g2507.t1 [Galdieria partita]|uniref:Mis18 domain-containing protein n=1 Tax=Galdieria partita TaxID=83374 RepID=A0A9C7PUN0_9RHOD|nr:hypothetical protein GpartN1_g1391.t1 [Galdieria partita]GJQ10716.1 hypothetical protein GpartN1_g2507.t1 [Galdieria partita]